MKSKVLLASLAVATVAATTANATVALSDLRTAPIVRISGATAPDNTFNEAFLLNNTGVASASAIFEDGSIRRFVGAADGDDFTLTCGDAVAAVVSANSDAATFVNSEGDSATLSAGSPLCILKVAHGSGQGTNNVGQSIPLNFADLTQIIDGAGNLLGASSCSVASTVPAANADQQTYELHTGCDVTADFVPDCGVADVEPALFAGADPANFDSGSTIDIPWGMQASLPLYTALQAVQYAGTSCDPGEAGYNGGADDIDRSAACQPSLSLGVIRSIFTNDLVFADELRDDNGNPLRTSPDVTSVPAITGVTTDDGFSAAGTGGDGSLSVTPGDGTVSPVPAANASTNHMVYLCRRKNTSGTQASYEAKFLRQRCEAGSLQMAFGNLPGSFNLAGDNSGNADFLGSTGTDNVYENDGSSDVEQCMDQATVQNVWAIGINSTEKVSSIQSNIQRDGWEHVKIDGVAPTSLNVTKGYHSFFSSVAGNTRAGEDSAGGAPELCREAVFDSASSALVVSGSLPTFVQEWGQGGALASADKAVNNLPIATYAGGLTEAELADNPVNQFSVSTSGALNNCAYPTKIPSPNTTDIIPAGAGEIQ